MARVGCHTPLHQRIRELRGEGEKKGHRKTRTGKVTGIHEDYDDKSVARVDLQELGLKGTAEENGAATAVLKSPSKAARSFTVEVPKAHTAGLKLGDRVHVHTTIEKA